MNLQPTQDKVIIKLDDKVTKVGSIHLPDDAQEKPKYGTVIAIGKGRMNEKGVFIPTTLKVNDKVLINDYGAVNVKVDGINYKILAEDEILAIINV